MLRRGDDRAGIFNIAKEATATNRNVVGDKCVENDRGVVATSDQEKVFGLERALCKSCK